MMKQICAAALMAAMISPAIAQEKEKVEYRNPKPLTQPDMAILQEAVDTVGTEAECEAEYVISTEAKPISIVPNCSDDAYDPYVVRALESMEYQSEIYGFELFDSEPLKMPFVFKGTGPAAASGVAPKVSPNLNPRDIERANNRVDEAGSCNVVFTVGLNGEPKDIEPNCEPTKFDSHIEEAIGRMRFEPGQKDGVEVEWPGMQIPLTLTKPEG